MINVEMNSSNLVDIHARRRRQVRSWGENSAFVSHRRGENSHQSGTILNLSVGVTTTRRWEENFKKSLFAALFSAERWHRWRRWKNVKNENSRLS